MLTGISILVTEGYWSTQKCDLCEELLGEREFKICIMPKPGNAAETLIGEITYQHLNCAKLMGEATDASFEKS